MPAGGVSRRALPGESCGRLGEGAARLFVGSSLSLPPGREAFCERGKHTFFQPHQAKRGRCVYQWYILILLQILVLSMVVALQMTLFWPHQAIAREVCMWIISLYCKNFILKVSCWILLYWICLALAIPTAVDLPWFNWVYGTDKFCSFGASTRSIRQRKSRAFILWSQILYQVSPLGDIHD